MFRYKAQVSLWWAVIFILVVFSLYGIFAGWIWYRILPSSLVAFIMGALCPQEPR